MSVNVMMVAVFASVSLGVVGLGALVYEYFFRYKSRIQSRVEEEFFSDIRQRVRQSPLFRDLQQLSENNNDAKAESLAIKMQTVIEQSGLQWTLNQTVIGMMLSGLLSGLLMQVFGGLWFSIPGTMVGALLPLSYIYKARSTRMNLLSKQLPEAFDVMGRAIRAGLSVPAAFQSVASDFPMPICEEFAQCYEQQHLGISYEVSLRELARRTGTMETRIFAIALIINRRLGGNLAELLTKLALTMRSRSKFSGRVRALTGEGRMQAAVLIALPIVMLMALMVLNRPYVQVLFDRPFVLIGVASIQAIGAACIYKIINFRL